jgi:hypothetical protein
LEARFQFLQGNTTHRRKHTTIMQATRLSKRG